MAERPQPRKKTQLCSTGISPHKSQCHLIWENGGHSTDPRAVLLCSQPRGSNEAEQRGFIGTEKAPSHWQDGGQTLLASVFLKVGRGRRGHRSSLKASVHPLPKKSACLPERTPEPALRVTLPTRRVKYLPKMEKTNPKD
jgi:hypothetical protein